MNKQHFYRTIKTFIIEGGYGGRITREIAEHYKITNRQVGGLMSALNKKGLVHTYTGGTITFTQRDGSAAPCGLSNSFYSWVGN